MRGMRPPSPTLFTTPLVLALSLMASCGNRSPRPDILLVTIDTLRADHVGCYGYSRPTTPNLDRLAREGVRYGNCQSVAPITLPSHATILTGQLPPRHGVRNNTSYRLPESVPTLAEALRAQGYRCGAFVGALPVAARFGLDRGFDVYDDALPQAPQGFHFPERPARMVVQSAMRWVREQDSHQPVFTWVHFFEPHHPYEPPPPFDGSFADRPYDGEIAAADAALGDLLEAWTATRETSPLVVVTSDHGEGLGEHGEASHTLFLFQTTLHVPLVLHWSDRLVPGVIDEPVTLADIAPTILRTIGADARTRLQADGRALDPGASPPRRRLYAETLYPLEAYGWSPAFALREGPRKVIRSARSRAYLVDEDASERNDLLPDSNGPAWARDMLAALDSMVGAQSGQGMDATRRPTNEEVEALAALGYVGGTGSVQLDGAALLAATAERPDVATRLLAFDRLTTAQNRIHAGRPYEAIEIAEEILDQGAENAWAWIVLGEAHDAMARADAGQGSTEGSLTHVREARVAYARANSLWPNRASLQHRLARRCRELGESTAAMDFYERALGLDPFDPELNEEVAEYRELLDGVESDRGVVLRARQLDREQRWPELVTLLADPDRLDGQRGEAHLYLGIAQYRLGRVDDAMASFRRAVSLDDSLHLAHNNLAWLLATRNGDYGTALRHARRAIELSPDEPEYHDTYLEVLERMGRDEEARSHLAEVLPRFPRDPALQGRAVRYGL